MDTSPPGLRVEARPLDTLIPYARNARKHSDAQVAQLAAGIAEFGWTNPVLVDGRGIVAGHGRVMAARQLYATGKTIRLAGGGMLPAGSVPVIDCAGWTEAQRRAYVLWDNKSALNAAWDEELLAIELRDLGADGFDLDLTGFGADELDELLAEANAREVEGVEEDEDAPLELPDEPRSVPGEAYDLGPHRLVCGDATDPAVLGALMRDERADVWWTDPPYNVAYEGGTGLTIANDSMDDASFRRFLAGLYSAADAVMRPGACFYIAHADSEGFNFRGAARDVGWHLAQCLIWVKDAFVLSRQDYHWRHEPILYGWKPGAAHHALKDRTQDTVWEFPRPKRSAEHPTMKPPDLIERALRNSTRPGGIVLDSCGGSGSTLIAAARAGRRARLVELDPRYCDVIRERWERFSEQVTRTI